LARAELGRLQRRRERVEGLERDRDAVIESYVGMLPDALEALSGEERRRLYGMLRLEAAATPDSLEATRLLVYPDPAQQLRDGTDDPGGRRNGAGAVARLTGNIDLARDRMEGAPA
jgi:hypothetical protein